MEESPRSIQLLPKNQLVPKPVSTTGLDTEESLREPQQTRRCLVLGAMEYSVAFISKDISY